MFGVWHNNKINSFKDVNRVTACGQITVDSHYYRVVQPNTFLSIFFMWSISAIRPTAYSFQLGSMESSCKVAYTIHLPQTHSQIVAGYFTIPHQYQCATTIHMCDLCTCAGPSTQYWNDRRGNQTGWFLVRGHRGEAKMKQVGYRERERGAKHAE